jgi:acyl dehydratase
VSAALAPAVAAPASIELHCGPFSAVDLALYAAASGDHNPLHLDADVAQAAGFAKPVVHGMLTMACVARLFTERFGATALLALTTRFTGVALRGDGLALHATLTEHDDRTATYTLRGGTLTGSEVVTGSARVRLRAAGG